jgi:hypothetical protein
MTAPNRSHIRTYEMRLARKSGIQRPDCEAFHKFVERIAYAGREILDFKKIIDQSRCEVELRVRCKSFGKTGPHRLTRNIALQFPDVTVVQVMRQRP